jgi:hypothetical protein
MKEIRLEDVFQEAVLPPLKDHLDEFFHADTEIPIEAIKKNRSKLYYREDDHDVK